MFLHRGFQVSSSIELNGDAEIGYEVCCDSVELCFGGRRGNFQIFADEEGLAELLAKGSAALTEMRAGGTDE